MLHQSLGCCILATIVPGMSVPGNTVSIVIHKRVDCVKKTSISNVTIFDGTGGKPFVGYLLVEGNRIKSVKRGKVPQPRWRQIPPSTAAENSLCPA